MNLFSLSIVSHGHARFIEKLLRGLSNCSESDFEVVLTLNFPETIAIDLRSLPFHVEVLNNLFPKGFAANHNAAFLASRGANFVILNPDIELLDDPFVPLARLMITEPHGIYAPVVVNRIGVLEDSMRRFPSPFALFKKLLARTLRFELQSDPIPSDGAVYRPDWVAGMFVVVPRAIYARLAGLNERYHMYYEDVDFCARARLAGFSVLVSKDARVIHEAQRDSHRKFRYFVWHLQSALKFFTSKAYWKIGMRRFFRTGSILR